MLGCSVVLNLAKQEPRLRNFERIWEFSVLLRLLIAIPGTLKATGTIQNYWKITRHEKVAKMVSMCALVL